MNTASQTATGLEAFVQQNLDILAAEAKLPVFSRYLGNVERGSLGTDATNELANSMDSGVTQGRVASVLGSLSSRDPVYILSYALLDRSGKNLADSAVPSITVGVGDVTTVVQDESGREYFERALETGTSYVSSVRFYPEGLAQAPEGSTSMPKDARPSLYFSSPVKNVAGEVLGVLRIRYDAAILQQLITARNGLAGEGSFAMLVDENNLILAHGDEPNWLYKSITPPIPEQLQAFQEAGVFPSEDSAIALTEEEWESLSDLSDELRKVDDSAVFVAETHTHKGEHLEQAAVVKLTDLPWFVVFAQPQEIFLQPIDRQRNRAIFVAFIIAAIATGLAYAGARFLSAPLIQLTTIAENVAAGDLSVTVPKEVMALTDEIGVLASTFSTMTERLRRIWSQLEGRVASRTRALEQRSRYLEASAEVGRVVTSILEPEQLIEEVVGLIRDRFDLYYVGLFLVDSRRQWAELRAGTGEAGRAMLARRHRLPVDESESMVGWTIVHGEARVAQDIDLDDVQRATPELPDTRAEAALPLRARGEVLGALTVQSREYGIFDQDVLRVLQIMADQVAAALDNAQLYAQSQAALEMSSRVYGELNRQAWEDILRFRPEIKVRSDRYGVSMLSDDDGDGDAADVAEAVAEPHEEVPPSEEHHRPLSVSIEGRGGIIGALETYKVGQDEDWTPEEVAMLEEIADRVGQALDSARLYRDSQQSAIREQLTTEITARIREEVEVEAILQRALEELGRELGAKRATVQLEVQE
jgi:GAF domain-containing protein/HAMP domain-containing protein